MPELLLTVLLWFEYLLSSIGHSSLVVMVQVVSARAVLCSLDSLYYHCSASLVHQPIWKKTWEV